MLAAGEVVERGTHAELLDQNGLYAGMWTRQRQADQARELLAMTGEDGDFVIESQPASSTAAVDDMDKPPVIAVAASTVG
jgi:hypothetical protein